jgi:predicted RecB family nuclease
MDIKEKVKLRKPTTVQINTSIGLKQVKKDLLDEIKLYNREDCESTYFLREWLSDNQT